MTETELNALLAGITPANEAARAAAHAHWASLAKPLGGLGRLETMLEDAAALTGTAELAFSRRAVLVLCADDGVVAISLAVNRKTGAMMAQPVVSAMGFLYDSEHVKIEAACRQHAAIAVARIAASGKKVQEAVSSGQLQGQLRSFLYERTKRRPVVMINLIEVDS